MASILDNPALANPWIATNAADAFDGSGGRVTVSYENSPAFGSGNGAGVKLNTNQGRQSALGDTYSNIKNIIGSRYSDLLVGNGEDNILVGGAGNDDLEGRGGNDILSGGAGEDFYRFVGNWGADIIRDENDGGLLFGAIPYFSGRTLVGEGDPGDLGVLDFSRASNGDVTISLGDNSVTIEGYADGRYDLSYYIGNKAGALWLGTEENDAALTGTGEKDVLFGFAGDDILKGGGKNDYLYGGAGNDRLVGGEGSDVLQGGAGRDTLVGGAGNDLLEGGVGIDILMGGAGHDNYVFEGNWGADTLQGETDASNLYFRNAEGFSDFSFSRATNGDVTISEGDNSLTILAADFANDRYSLHYGQDNTLLGKLRLAEPSSSVVNLPPTANGIVLVGVEGQNRLEARADENPRSDFISGGAGPDTLKGLGGNDYLYGGAGTDELYGGAGDDRLEGGAGIDILIGGTGTDNYVFEGNWGADTIQGETDASNLYFRDAINLGSLAFSRAANGDVTISVGDNSVTIASADFAADRYVLHYGAENTLLGKLRLAEPSDSVVNLPPAADGILLVGLNGKNILSAKETEDPRPDLISGGAGDDLLRGLGGNDELYGGKGVDVIYGATGDDILEGGEGADFLFGGRGVDTLSYANSKDVEGDGSGVTVALSSTTTVTLPGNEGTYSAAIGEGDDAQGDSIIGHGADTIENIIGSAFDDQLTGTDAANNRLEGRGGADTLIGFAGDDTLIGGEGEDILSGGAGADTLIGGKGNDTLFGGEDADIYVFGGNWGADTLRGDRDGGMLRFTDAAGFGAFTFSRESNGDAVIQTNDGSVKILSAFYEGGRFILQHGNADSLTTLGALHLATEGGDTFVGSEDADIFGGGSGRDTISYEGDTEGVNVNLQANTFSGGNAAGDHAIAGSIEIVIGGTGADTLTGDANGNRLVGNAGADTLDGGVGRDFLEGGAGEDTYVFEGSYGTDIIRNDGDGGILRFVDAAGLGDFSFSRATNGDVVIQTGDDSVKILAAAYGNGRYTLQYGTSASPTTLGDLSLGTAGNDRGDAGIRGGSDADLIQGLIGNDQLYGEGGEDNIFGGEGHDRLEGGDNDDMLYGGLGNDRLFGDDGADMLYGGRGNDILSGGAGADTYVFNAGWGQDTLLAEEDTSKLYFRNVNDQGEFAFSRASSGDVTISVGSDSIEIQDYADGLYSLHYGASNTQLGRLKIGTAQDNAALTGTTEEDLIYGLAGIDTLRGDAGADRLYGGLGNDRLEGGGGDDHLYGGAGNDILAGGAGDDVFDGGSGRDTITYEASTTSIVVNLETNTLGGGDTMVAGSIQNVIGGTVADTLTGDANGNRLVGNAGADTLEGGGGRDFLEGGAGEDIYVFGGNWGADVLRNDEDGGILRFTDATGLDDFTFLRASNGDVTISTSGGSVKILAAFYEEGRYTLQYGASDSPTTLGKLAFGTDGNDLDGSTLTGTGEADLLLGLAGNDRLEGGGGNDALYGGLGNDRLNGGAGVDYLYGGAGNDILAGGAGDDVFDGGIGRDTITYESSATAIEVNLATNTLAGGDTMVAGSIQNVIGGTVGDTLTGDANGNRLVGNAGADTLEGGGGRDFLEGGAGEDIYVFGGDWGADVLRHDADGGILRFTDATGLGDFTFSRATNGDAIISVGENSVKILAASYEEGRYTLQYGASDSPTTLGKLAFGTDGDDFDTSAVTGTGEADLLFGFAGNDILEGGGSNDALYGGVGNDRLDGGGGDDYLYGGAGNDFLAGGAGDDVFDGGIGRDTITYETSTTTIEVNLATGDLPGGDTIVGDSIENVIGGTVADRLTGDRNANRLVGNAGDDFLYGNAGNDFLEGGVGRDEYVFEGSYGVDVVRRDDDGGILRFVNVAGLGDLAFSRASNGDVVIQTSGGSVKILGAFYGDGRYTLQYGAGASLTTLGELSFGTNGNDRGSEGAITGSSGADLIEGLVGNDQLYGGGGEDNIGGGVGNDRLEGGDDNDNLYGGDGIDRLFGDGGADRLEGGTGNDFLTGGAGVDSYVFNRGWGQDTIEAEGDASNLYFRGVGNPGNFAFSRASNGDVTISVGGNSVKILAAAYADGRYTAFYGASDIELGKLFVDRTASGVDFVGNVEANWLAGTQAGNVIKGEGGNDVLHGLGGEDILEGGADDDRLYGGDHVDSLYGDVGDDILYGGAGRDKLYGGEGDDTLVGGASNDRLEGGVGEDTYFFGGSWGTDFVRGETDQDGLILGDPDGGTLYFRDAGSLRDLSFEFLGRDLVIEGQGGAARIKGYLDSLYGISYGTGEARRDEGKLVLGTNDDETITGTGAAELLLGLLGNDELQGGAGDDSLYGGGGNDILQGHGDADDFHGGGGIDTLTYKGSSEGVSVDLQTNTFSGGDAAGDSLLAFGTIENLAGSAERDILKGDTNANTIIGATGDDDLYGGGGFDRLEGGAGDDRLEGGAGRDQLYGDAGSDTYVIGASDGHDILHASSDNSDAADAENKIVFLTYGEGYNARGHSEYVGINGQLVHPSLSAEREANGDIRISLNDVVYAVGSVVDGVRLPQRNIPILDIASVTIKDLVSNRYEVILRDRAGGDTTFGKLSVAETRTVDGKEISTFTAEAGDGGNLILGFAGKDFLYGGAGDDRIYGGVGDDTIEGGDGADNLYGGDGADTIEGGDGRDNLEGGDGDDILKAGDDEFASLRGDGGNDYLQGGDGYNTLSGGAGDDVIEGGGGGERIELGAGIDTLSYESSPDGNNDGVGVTFDMSTPSGRRLFGVGEDAEGDDVRDANNLYNLIGSAYADTLIGDEKNNVLRGLAGADTLEGGDGRDFLEGGAGADTYVFGGNWGNDVIRSNTYVGEGVFNFKDIGGDVDGGTLNFRDQENIGDLSFRIEGEGRPGVRAGQEDLVISFGENSVRVKDYVEGNFVLSLGAEAIPASEGNPAVPSTLKTFGKLKLGTTGNDIGDLVLTGTGEADLLLGLAGNDHLAGGAGDDYLYGGAGNDHLAGGAGDDVFDGGSGRDTITYEASTTSIVVNLNTNTLAGGDTMVAGTIENVIGGTVGDRLTGDANGNRLVGNAGNDFLYGFAGNDFLEGGAGADVYVFEGNYGADVIRRDDDGGILRFVNAAGLGDLSFSRESNGDLVISTSGGSVKILAAFYEDGRYTLQYGASASPTTLGKLKLGTNGNDNNAGGSPLIGTGEADLLLGLLGNDRLEGGAGDDYLAGGAGNDYLVGGAGADVFDGGSGRDTITYEASTTAIVVNLATNTLAGGDSAVAGTVENVLGGTVGDTLTGDANGNRLVGNAGADTLDGGDGRDFLEGGAGADTYVFSGNWGDDVIRYDEDGGTLNFKDRENLGGFSFKLEGEGSPGVSAGEEDLVVSLGENSVRIKDFSEGDFVITLGTGSTLTTLGKLKFGTEGNDVDDKALTGTGEADLLLGLAGNDRLEGGAGNDYLVGGAGNDFLVGGAGDDVFDGGSGRDTITYEASTTSIVVNLNTNTLAGGDTMVAGTIENVIGGTVGDRLTGDANGNRLVGNAGNDFLYGNAGNDFLEGGEGVADEYVFEGDYGADVIRRDDDGGILRFVDVAGLGDLSFSRASNGDLTISTSGGSVKILAAFYEDGRYTLQYGASASPTTLGKLKLGTNENDNTASGSPLTGTGEADLLLGFAGNDRLEGGAGDDYLAGGAGNDYLVGGAGADVFDGGSGRDTITYEASATSIVVNLETNTLAGGDSAVAGTIENVIGGTVGDRLTGDANGNRLVGGAGADTLDGGDGRDFLEGGEGVDTYVFGGNWGDDVIRYDEDGGTLNFKDRADIGGFSFNLEGEGSPGVSAGEKDLVVSLGENSVRVKNFAEGDFLISLGTGGALTTLGKLKFGTEGNDVDDKALTGTGEADLLLGLAGNDFLVGGAGDDYLYGGAGNDHLAGGAGDDVFDGGSGRDTITYEASTTSIVANLNTNTLAGGDTMVAGSIENIIGGTVGDRLTGDANGNRLVGNAGNDFLYGFAGNDFLEGGAGADVYVFEGNYGADVIRRDDDGGILRFVNAAGLGDLSFSRESNGDLVISTSGGSVKILAAFYEDGRYTLQYGASASPTTLGKLKLGTNGNDNNAGGSPLIGTGEADLLLGLLGNDRLEGGAGDDYLAGGAGNDYLVGGAGADVFDGGSGRDTITYEASTTAIVVNLATNTLAGGDSAVAGTVENVLGGTVGDTLTGDANGNRLVGNAGADTLDGGDGRDFLEGGEGADTYVFSGNWGDDVIRYDEDGGTLNFKDRENLGGFSFKLEGEGSPGVSAGEEDLVVSLGENSVRIKGFVEGDFVITLGTGSTLTTLGKLKLGTDANDNTASDSSLIGTSEADLLLGLAGNDRLEGGAGDDYLAGGAGNDFLVGGAGDDVFDGGSGRDTITYEASTTSIVVNLNTNTMAGGDSAVAGSIENVIGGTVGDRLTGDANGNRLVGNAGNDFLYGNAGNDFLEGGEGVADEYVFEGDYGADVIRRDDDGGILRFVDVAGLGDISFSRASNGDLTISTSGGSVKILAAFYEDGRYTLQYGASSSPTTLGKLKFGTDGNDIGDSTLTGTGEADLLLGFAGNDRLEGGAGDDYLAGGAGNDFLVGGAGDDVFDGGSGRDTITYEASTTSIEVNLATNTLAGGDTMIAGTIENVLGGTVGDRLTGDANGNRLVGNAGDDFLYGGAGNDFLEGGEGVADEYVFEGDYGANVIRRDDDGGILRFVNAAGLGDLSFLRESNGDLTISTSGGSVKILAAFYEDGRYTLQYGPTASPTTLGKLNLGTNANDIGENALTGTGEADLLVGLLGNDFLVGGAGDDYLAGGAGNDYLVGGAGDDVFDGGSGRDTVSYEASTTSIVANLATNTLGGGDTMVAGSIENVIGGTVGDRLTGDANGNRLVGNAGDDFLYGSAGNDFLEGGAGVADEYVFEGDYGADTIREDDDGGILRFADATGLGDFTFSRASNGDVTISVGDGSVKILAAFYEDGRYTLQHGTSASPTNLGKLNLGTNGDDVGDLALTGTGEADLLVGLLGNDRLEGGDGDDYLDGGEGNDFLVGGAGADVFDGGGGRDTIVYEASTTSIVANLETNTLPGGDRVVFGSVENIIGGTAADTLTGDAKGNRLVGNAGADTLDGVGGEARDFLEGGAGEDIYVFEGDYGEDIIREDEDGGILRFADATGLDDFSFSRASNGDLTISASGGSVKILAAFYEDGRYTLQYGASGSPTTLGVLSLGTSGDDRGVVAITGGTGGDLILGFAGNDQLYGEGGEDGLYGGVGNDRLEGGDNDDILYGGGGIDRLYGDGGADRLYGGAGNDFLTGGAGVDSYVFEAGWGQDTIEAEADASKLYFRGVEDPSSLSFSRASNDDVIISAGENSVKILAAAYADGRYSIYYGGSDTLFGTATLGTNEDDKDTLSLTGDGDENVLVGLGGDDTLQGLGGDDTLYGGAGVDRLDGGANNDRLYGGAGVDTLIGGTGDDTLEGGAGGDFFDGGAGIDTISYRLSGAGVRVSVNGSFSGGHAAGDNILSTGVTSIQNFVGSSFGDYLKGGSGSNTLSGGGGADTLEGDGEADILEGGAGADTYIFGTFFAYQSVDTIRGDGNDAAGVVNKLYFRNANFEGAGISSLLIEREEDGDVRIETGNDGSVRIAAASYADGRYQLFYGANDEAFFTLSFSTPDANGVVRGTADGDFLLGLAGEQTYRGLGGDDIIYGGADVDILHGGDGADTLLGGADADTLYGDEGADTLFGGEGADTLYGGDGRDILIGGAGSDIFDGGAGIDTLSYADFTTGVLLNIDANSFHDDSAVAGTIENLVGGSGDDYLWGDSNGNRLFGGEGADTLDGFGGRDFLEGGAGADTYLFSNDYGTDTVRNDADGGVLRFENVENFGDFVFSSNSDGDVIISTGSNSVRIVAASYADARYTLQYGDGTSLTTLGKLSVGTDGNDRDSASIRGSSDTDLILGLTGNDQLYGLDGADTLYGGDGNDLLDGGDGGDTLVGGDGVNTLGYASSDEAVDINLRAGTWSGGHADDDIISNINSFGNILGSTHDDTLEGNTAANILRGGLGDDMLTGGGGNDRLEGGEGSDIYIIDHRYGVDSTEIDRIQGDHNDAEGVVNHIYFTKTSNQGELTIERDENDDVVITTANGHRIVIAEASYADGRYQIHYGSENTGLPVLTFALTQVNNEGVVVGTDSGDFLLGLAGAQEYQGGDGDDYIFGGGGDDTLRGGEGADTLIGGKGNDILEGGLGGDIFIGGAGIDTITYENAASGVYINLDNFSGTFTAKGSGTNEASGDSLAVNTAIPDIENLKGSAFNDDLFGSRLDNTLYGGGGNDELYGRAGNDILYGGEGNDKLYGGDGNDKLYGGAGSRSDEFYGGAGDDLLVGSEASRDNYIFYAENGADTIEDSGTEDGSLYFAAWGRSYSSIFSIDREADGDIRFSTGGDNRVTIKADSYSDGRFTLRTGERTSSSTIVRDFSFSTAENGIIEGGGGSDFLVGSTSVETLRGLAGNDHLYGGAGADTLEGGAGSDTLGGGAGVDNYIFNSGDGTDYLYERAGDNNLYFKGIDDIASFSSSTSSFQYQTSSARYTVKNPRLHYGDDILVFFKTPSANADPLAEGRYNLYHGSNDRLLGKLWIVTDDAAFTGSDQQDIIFGRSNADNDIRGGDGADIIVGGSGVDTLRGEDGNDRLYGGAGIDTLIGGAGNDILEGGAQGDSFLGGGGFDTISYKASNEGVIVNLHTQSFSGGHAAGDGGTLDSIENLAGSQHGDRLTGNDDSNTITGHDEADTLTGRAGNDILRGGEGDDTYIFNSGDGEDIIRGDTDGSNRLFFKSATGIDDFSIRLQNGNPVVTLGNDAVTIEDYANGLYSIFYGNDNTLLGHLNFGTSGNDVPLEGTAEADLLFGLAGDDTIRGGAGDDIIYGGGGTETYVFQVGGGADTINDVASGGDITLRFEGSGYVAADFSENSANFAKVGRNLEITIDKDSNDNIDDKVTINNAFTESGEAAYTISVEYGDSNSLSQVIDTYWNALT